jgi:hypothetical protein
MVGCDPERNSQRLFESVLSFILDKFKQHLRNQCHRVSRLQHFDLRVSLVVIAIVQIVCG